METRLVDDDGDPVPPGEIGEIVHRSPHAALGYYDDEEKTAEAFRGGWFHSGDLGVMTEDGYLSVVDRKKDMIKTGGENVASREVEEAIYELDGVAEVAVFGISHPHWIEAVTAVVVPKAGATLTADDVHAHAARPARRLQAAQVRRLRRRPAEEPERQDPQARAARGARRSGGRRRGLTGCDTGHPIHPNPRRVGDRQTGRIGDDFAAAAGLVLDVSMRDVAAQAASLPSDDATVIADDVGWAIDGTDGRIRVGDPRARPVTTRSATLRADPERVLAEVEGDRRRAR